MPQVIIRAKKDGTVEVEAEGYMGPSCSEITSPYCRALGVQTNSKNKPEFFAQETTTNTINQQN